MQELLEKS